MKRKPLSLIAVLIMISTLFIIPAEAQSSNPAVYLGGNLLNSQAVIDGDTVFLPVRSLCEAMGYKVTWASVAGISTVSIKNDSDSIALDLTNNKISDNGHTYYAQSDSGNGIDVISGSSYLDSELFDSIFSMKTKFDTAKNQVFLSGSTENSIKISAVSLNANEKYLDATIQYPQISGLKDSSIQEGINDVLKKAALSSETEGQKNASDMAQYISEGYEYGDARCVTYFDYSVRYNQQDLLSVILTDYQFLGGAHGSTYQSSYTFDLTTGKTLSLSDLMQSGTDYTAYFNSGIRKAIDERVASGLLYEFETGKFSSIGDNPAYYLTENGIVFYFQQYDYFPYAAGIQTFSFPYSDLSKLLKTQYLGL